ncbi:alpha/beta-hydrolase [Hypoxylon fuscum]|nr:alpha/beta-hydrolase [Hypoxylon fuscum]
MELGQSVVAPLIPSRHTHTVIFLHGRGDTSANIADVFLTFLRTSHGVSLIDTFPSVRWVFPQAEDRLASKYNEVWPQWFDVWNILDMTDCEELQAPGLRESVASIRRIVRREAERVGGLDRIVLAGISQGGATAAHALFHLGAAVESDAKKLEHRVIDIEASPPPKSPTRLAALMGFSSWLPFPGGSLEETREVLGLEGEEEEEESSQQSSDEVVHNTPVFLSHCADDPLVFVEYGLQLRDGLREFGMNVTWKEYPEGGHWINAPQGVDDVVEFLKGQGIPAVG